MSLKHSCRTTKWLKGAIVDNPDFVTIEGPGKASARFVAVIPLKSALDFQEAVRLPYISLSRESGSPLILC